MSKVTPAVSGSTHRPRDPGALGHMSPPLSWDTHILLQAEGHWLVFVLCRQGAPYWGLLAAQALDPTQAPVPNTRT